MMALPSPQIISNGFQQRALLVWNLFPLSFLLLHKILGAMTTLCLPNWKPERRSATSVQEHIRAIRIMNFIAIFVSAFVHIALVSLSICTVMFPIIFTEGFLTELNPRSLFLPPMSMSRGETVGDGVRGFLLWDQVAGYPVMILVMMRQLRMAGNSLARTTSWINMAGMAVGIACVAGPGSACLALSWLRDELLFGCGGEMKAEEKSSPE